MDTRLAQASEETVAQIVTPVDQAELTEKKAEIAAEKARLVPLRKQHRRRRIPVRPPAKLHTWRHSESTGETG